MYSIAIDFPNLSLLPGNYVLRGHALDPKGIYLFDHVEIPFVVIGHAQEFGLASLSHAWQETDQVPYDSKLDRPRSSRHLIERMYAAKRNDQAT